MSFKQCLKENNWMILSLSLCVFGFLKEIRPSEPFVYEFLSGEWRNITGDEVTQQVYPVGTYSYLTLLVLVFLITDVARYKPLIVFSGVSGIIVWSLLLWTTSLFELQIVQVFYGSFAACEVAYFTYIYAKVDKEYFQQVTSHTRAAILAGRSISGILGQSLISFHVMDYRQLNYITFAAMLAATLWSLLLPPVTKSIYFHHEQNQLQSNKTKMAFKLMWAHFKDAFTNKYIIKWSAWWSLATCGFIQVQTYMQPLWTVIVDNPNQSIYNGAVEFVLTILGFLGALAAGFLKVDWKTRGELMLTCCSLMQGFILLITSQTQWILASYICYVCFGALFHLTITIASSEIAKCIQEDSYGLVFGINTFVALIFQSILTILIVTTGVGFGLAPRQQYFAYGIYHVVLGFIYIVIGLVNWLASKRDYRRASVVSEPRTRTVVLNH